MKRFNICIPLGTPKDFDVGDVGSCKRFSSNVPAPNMILLDVDGVAIYDGFTLLMGEKRDLVSNGQQIKGRYTGFIPVGRYLGEPYEFVFQFD